MKRTIDDLAIFGGRPCFDEPLHVGCPNIGDRERLLARINDLLDRRWLTNNGPFVHELESRIVEMIGVKHCIATCNGTLALEIAIRAAGLSGEVLVPSFTFIATAHALQWQQIRPVFCDIDPETHNIDPRHVERMINPHTSGIIGVHLWGRACDVETLAAISEARNLKLIFDAAHAFGCSHRGRMIGSFGDAEVFSFHATKFLNSFEGGAVVTNNDDLAAKMRLMRNFGFTGYDNVSHIGTNGKMSEVAAAMALTSLESMEEFMDVNRHNYNLYAEVLPEALELRLVRYDEAERCNYQYMVLEIDEGAVGMSRDQLQAVLHAENILARRYFYPGCHRMEPYRSLQNHDLVLLPITERVAHRVLLLPTGTAVASDDIVRTCQLLCLVVEHANAIRAKLARMSVRIPADGFLIDEAI